jgi:plastocyanin
MIAVGAILLFGAPAQAQGGTHIAIKNYMFMPTALTIEQGQTVTWTNQDVAAHNVVVTSGPASFSSPMIAQGKSWSHTFSVTGPYSYICSVHPGMKATINVTAPRQIAHAAAPAGGTVIRAAHVQQRVPAAAKPSPDPTAVTSTAVADAPTVVTAPPAAATLQPLLLVVGAAVAAVVLCLLLMASRPVTGTASLDAEGLPVPKHLDSA